MAEVKVVELWEFVAGSRSGMVMMVVVVVVVVVEQAERPVDRRHRLLPPKGFCWRAGAATF